MIGLLLDIGNLIFFIANVPQIITAFRNRRNLKGLSSTMLFLYFVATILFGTVSFMTQGYIAFMLCIINNLIYVAQIYWKLKYKTKV